MNDQTKDGLWGYLAGIASGLAISGGVVLVLALVNPLAAGQDPEAIAGKMDMSIVWDASSCRDDSAVGCFWPTTPDLIFIAPGMDAEMTRQVVLHELGHTMQFRLGLDQSECGADTFAQSLGGRPAVC